MGSQKNLAVKVGQPTQLADSAQDMLPARYAAVAAVNTDGLWERDVCGISLLPECPGCGVG